MKKLLVASLLLVGTSLCAQTNAISMHHDLVSNQNYSMKIGKLQLQNPLVNSKAVDKINKLSNLPFNTPIAKTAETTAYLGIARAAAVESGPRFFNVNIQIEGTSAVVKGILPYNGIADVTGTVSGDELKITKEQKVLELKTSSAKYDVLLSEFNLEKGVMSDIVFKKENGRYVYVPSSDNHIVLVYVLMQGKPSVLEGFLDITINLPENLEPNYTSLPDLWYYGISEDGNALEGTAASVPSDQGSIQWFSYVSAFKNPTYSVNWSYTADETPVTPEVSSNGILNMKLDPSVEQYSFPTVSATSGGYTNEYGVDGFISVNTNSYVNTQEGLKDFGFSLSNIANKLMFSNLFGDYFYGSGEIYTETGSVKTVGVASVYQNVPSIKFSTIRMAAGVSANSLGKKLTLELKELVEDGDQLMIGQTIAKSEITLTDSENFIAYADNWGMITFDNFVGNDDGFEVPLDEITTGKNFALILNGVDDAEIGIAMDAVPNYAAAVLEAPETAYLIGEDGTMHASSTYANLCIYFYGSQFIGTGISQTSIAQDIVVVNKEIEFQLSYPEAINYVQIVNVAGQTVGEYPLEGTSATIPAANLAKGLYLLKFNTGATVKVMK